MIPPYLREQFRTVQASLETGKALEDVLATKLYIQTLIAETVERRVRPGSRVLEVGCGGSLALQLLEKRGYKCCGVDIDSESLFFSKVLTHYFKNTTVLVQADALALPFRSRQFDYVYSVGLIEHFGLNAQVKITAEMARCTTGFLHLEVPSYSEHGAFHSVLASSLETHLPYDLEQLANAVSGIIEEYDGRGVFPRRELVVANPRLRQFVESIPTYDSKVCRTQCDVAGLCSLERSLSIHERIRYGYQVYAVIRAQ